MIVEGLLTTENEDGSVNLAPMGPIVDQQLTSFHLRPFKSSTTYQNLKRGSSLVFHITDDVQLIARAALGRMNLEPQYRTQAGSVCHILEDCCRWYQLEISEFSEDDLKASILAKVVDQGFVREFFGLNRAKHAVIEAAILASRIHILEASFILSQLDVLEPLIEKTGGPSEKEAFHFLQNFIRTKLKEIESSEK